MGLDFWINIIEKEWDKLIEFPLLAVALFCAGAMIFFFIAKLLYHREISTLKTMLESLKNQKVVTESAVFPEFNDTILQKYAKRWAKKYRNIETEKIVLFRYNSDIQKHILIRWSKEAITTKYAIVFAFSGCKDIELSKLDSHPILEDDKCTTALKEIKFADQFASLGKHRLFDQAFLKAVYKDIPSISYYKEWTFILTRDKNISDVPNIYPDESIILWKRTT
jgi:hypothetical protein